MTLFEKAIALAGLLLAITGAVTGYLRWRWVKSQDMFLIVRNYLKEHRNRLVMNAFQEYHASFLEEDVPFLYRQEWLPEKPVPIHKVKLESVKKLAAADNPLKIIAQLKTILPYSKTGFKYDLYTDAIEALDKPKLFINRESYRLVDIGMENGIPYFGFSVCKYFDHLNIGEVLAYESARQMKAPQLSMQVSSLRKKLGDPYALLNRYVAPGIDTLTIRKEASKNTFFMLKRSSLNVATGMSSYHVVPAGEFQPSSRSPVSLREDLDFWRNMMREYSEEFLGYEEYYGDAGFTVDYESEPFQAFQEALDAGKLQCYYLGFGMDPLTLKGEILTVCIWEAEAFDAIFANIKWENEEGKIIGNNVDRKNNHLYGMPFDKDYIDQFIEDNTIPAGMACLRLAWKYREELGLTCE